MYQVCLKKTREKILMNRRTKIMTLLSSSLLLLLLSFLSSGTNRFHNAVTEVLAEDPQSDLTYMIADYMSYSTRINRSCVVLG